MRPVVRFESRKAPATPEPGSSNDVVVVELDVEVARAGVRAVDQDELEAVLLVGTGAVVADVHPVDAEGLVASHLGGSGRDRPVLHDSRAGAASVDVAPERRDQRAAGADDRTRRVAPVRARERDVPARRLSVPPQDRRRARNLPAARQRRSCRMRPRPRMRLLWMVAPPSTKKVPHGQHGRRSSGRRSCRGRSVQNRRQESDGAAVSRGPVGRRGGEPT